MKKWNIIIFLLLCVVSCTVDHEIPYIDVPDTGTDEANVKILLKVPGEAHPSTYAVSATEENDIVELDILAFAKNGAVDTFCYRVSVDPAKITNALGGTNGNMKDVDVKLTRYKDQQRLVLIANSKTVLDATTINTGESLTTVCDKLKFDYSGQWPTSPFVRFPMWGESDYILVQDPVVMARIDTVSLLRSIARVDLGVDVFASDPAIGFGNHFKIEHIYTYKMRSKGRIVPVAANYNSVSKKVTAPSVPSDATVLTTVQTYTVPSSYNSKFYNEIYIPESDIANASDNAFLVIGATYDNGPELFYRLDFVGQYNTPVDILRNHRYMLDIKNVSRPGFASQADAAAARSANLEYELIMTDDNMSDFVFDGQYYLGLSEGDIILDDATTRTIYVTTNYTGTPAWTVTYSGTFFGTTSATSTSVSFTPVPLRTPYMREGTITFRAGTLTKIVHVRQYAAYTNSILSWLATPTTYLIDFQTANLDGVSRYPSLGTYTMKLIWEDVSNLTGFTTSPPANVATMPAVAGAGNAVFGLYTPSNEPVWTWHLWRVPGFNPNSLANQVNIKGRIFMDRNLGATTSALGTAGSYGLMYQWGRKEPFPRAAAATMTDPTRQTVYQGATPVAITTQSVTTFANPLEDSHHNPTTFITSIEPPYFTWAGVTVSDNTLWKSTGTKSVYDPCPQGWRVPTAAEILNALTPTGAWNYGQAYAGGLVLPAAGGIDFSTGLFHEVGTDGYYWIAETVGVNARVLHIKNGSATIENAFRAHGFSVRCIKEKYDD
jgi:hypothetical protein